MLLCAWRVHVCMHHRPLMSPSVRLCRNSFSTHIADLGSFLEDCKDIKKKVIYWGVMQQKKKESLEARMRDLRAMASVRKPDTLQLAHLVGSLSSGVTGACTTRIESDHLPINLSPRYIHPESARHAPPRDSVRYLGVNESGHLPTFAFTHLHKGTSKQNPGAQGGAEFAPLAHRQRGTAQRLQEKTLASMRQGGFGSHKAVGPQCKYLPIMLGSLRPVDSSSSSDL